MQWPCRAPRPTRASALPLNPALRMTCEPRAIVGGVGATAGVVPWLITSGLYTWIWPFGARIVASMKTPSVPPLAQVQPSPSTHGVARPLALSGRSGTVTVQFVESAASASVWVKLNAFPAASTAFEPAEADAARGVDGRNARDGGCDRRRCGRRRRAGCRRAGDRRGRACRGAGRRGAGRSGRCAGIRSRGRLAPARRRRRAGGGGGARTQGRLRDRRRVTAGDGEDDSECQAQCHRDGERYRDTRRAAVPATAPFGPVPAEHSIHLHVGSPLCCSRCITVDLRVSARSANSEDSLQVRIF